MIKTGVVLVLTLFVMSLATVGASAHAALVATEPADGAIVATAPGHLTLTFSEPVSPLVFKLVAPDGSATALEDIAFSGKTLSFKAPQPLGTGTHVLSWRVTSIDGHPIGGALLFSIGAPGGAAKAGTETPDPAVTTGIWGFRVLLYFGLFFGAGGAFFSVWLADRARPGTGFARTAASVGLVAALVSLGLQGLDALGLPLSAIASASVWQAGLASSFAFTVLIAVLALLAALAGLRFPRGAKPLTALAMAGVGLALAASGHASSAEPQWLTRPAVFVHAIAIAFWAGALVPLVALLGTGPSVALPALRRFSRAIPLVVLALAAAGVFLAVTQVRAIPALFDTRYGNILVLKLALVVGLLGLAGLNRWWLTRPVEKRGDAVAARRLAWVITLETLLVLAIIGLVAGWRFTPPPRALALAAAPAIVTLHKGDTTATLTLSSSHPGPVAATLKLTNATEIPLPAQSVTLWLANPAAGIEGLRRPALAEPDGSWRIDGLAFPMAGEWRVRVDVLVSDFEVRTLDGTVAIRP